MTIKAVDFGGQANIDISFLSSAAIDQFAYVIHGASGVVTAASATTAQGIGFAQLAASAASVRIPIRVQGTSTMLAQTTITPGTHFRLGPTTTAGKIAPASTGQYCAVPLIEEAAAANDQILGLINLGSHTS